MAAKRILKVYEDAGIADTAFFLPYRPSLSDFPFARIAFDTRHRSNTCRSVFREVIPASGKAGRVTKRSSIMGDKSQKDKDKGQKQKNKKDAVDKKRKREKQEKAPTSNLLKR